MTVVTYSLTYTADSVLVSHAESGICSLYMMQYILCDHSALASTSIDHCHPSLSLFGLITTKILRWLCELSRYARIWGSWRLLQSMKHGTRHGTWCIVQHSNLGRQTVHLALRTTRKYVHGSSISTTTQHHKLNDSILRTCNNETRAQTKTKTERESVCVCVCM
jgi:hypothetical protein